MSLFSKKSKTIYAPEPILLPSPVHTYTIRNLMKLNIISMNSFMKDNNK